MRIRVVVRFLFVQGERDDFIYWLEGRGEEHRVSIQIMVGLDGEEEEKLEFYTNRIRLDCNSRK